MSLGRMDEQEPGKYGSGAGGGEGGVDQNVTMLQLEIVQLKKVCVSYHMLPCRIPCCVCTPCVLSKHVSNTQILRHIQTNIRTHAHIHMYTQIRYTHTNTSSIYRRCSTKMQSSSR